MNILIIDDETDLRRMLRVAIETEIQGSIRETASGLEAMQLLDGDWKPDVCFVDLLMPGMGAIDFLAVLRGNPDYQGIQVIVCSVGMDRNTLLRTSQYNVLSFLQKPIHSQEVAEVLALIQAALISQGRWPYAARFLDPRHRHSVRDPNKFS